MKIQTAYNVYLNRKCIDTVFYSSEYVKNFRTKKEVRESIKKSLIEHDGYNPNITVR